MSVTCKIVVNSEDINRCLTIRRKVFIEEQQVEEQLEIDGLDDEATHFIARKAGENIATARLRVLNSNTAKIERMAVLKEHRGSKVGKSLLEFILEMLRNIEDVETVKLSSQTQAVKFYEDFGFIICSDEYLDANIPHFDMILKL